MLIDTQI